MDDLGLTPQELALLQMPAKPTGPSVSTSESDDESSWPDPVCLRRQLEVLESFHQDVSSRFADALSRSLQRLVEVRLTQVESMSYSQFVASRQDPTCFVVLQAHPLPTSLVLDIAPPLLYPLVDCLLGGGNQPCDIPDRPATELEQRLVRGAVRTLLDELHDAWEPLLAIDLSIERIECHAPRVRVVAPSDAVASLVFQVNVADQTGEMTLCLPSRTIGKIIGKLLAGEYPGDPGNDTAEQQDGANEAFVESSKTSRSMIVQFTAEAISAEEVRQLRVGDVILSDLTLDSPVDLVVDDQPVAKGRLGAIRGRRAVEIE